MQVELSDVSSTKKKLEEKHIHAVICTPHIIHNIVCDNYSTRPINKTSSLQSKNRYVHCIRIITM